MKPPFSPARMAEVAAGAGTPADQGALAAWQDFQRLADASLVAKIRSICARELGSDPDYPFFNLCYLPGEDADAALLRMMRESLEHGVDGDSIEEIVKVWCHG